MNAAGMEWLFWAGGAALALGAVALVACGRVFDRSRGRRRCPKCWYSMEGVPAVLRDGNETWTCPECGVLIKELRGLHRSRRRIGWVTLGILLLVGAYPTARAPAMKAEGWTGLLPTSLLILIATPEQPNSQRQFQTLFTQSVLQLQNRGVRPAPIPPPLTAGESLTHGTWRRIFDGRAALWQSEYFIERHLRRVGTSVEQQVRVPTRWLKGEPVPILLETAPGAPITWLPGTLGVRDSTPAPGMNSNWWGGPGGRGSVVLVSGLHRGPLRYVLELGGSSGKLLYSREVAAPVELVDRAEDLVVPVDSPEASEQVRRALDAQLVRSFDELRVLSEDRNHEERWRAIDFSLVYRVEVVVDGRVVGTAEANADQDLLPWKNWHCLTVAWTEGGRELVEQHPERARLVVRGDVLRMLRMYQEWPFDGQWPRVWAGSYETPVRLEGGSIPSSVEGGGR